MDLSGLQLVLRTLLSEALSSRLAKNEGLCLTELQLSLSWRFRGTRDAWEIFRQGRMNVEVWQVLCERMLLSRAEPNESQRGDGRKQRSSVVEIEEAIRGRPPLLASLPSIQS